MKLPLFSEIKRTLPSLPTFNPLAELESHWNRLAIASKVKGKDIALAVGSRGIDRLPDLVRGVVGLVKAGGGRPFIIPAMGSHGGANAEGQVLVLEQLGITERAMGCPLISNMETVVVGRTPDGLPAYCDKLAVESGGVIIINRVKAHTSFQGDFESGLHKMLAIGLGKEDGARLLHQRGSDGLRDDMPRIARIVAGAIPFLAGVLVVEDGYHRLGHLEVLTAADLDREKGLLTLAKSLAPGLPLDDLDLLIVDCIGKNYSGTGMDTNVIGRLRISGQPEPGFPRIGVIVALDLSDASGGNALGIGLADFTVKKLVDKIDFALTAKNVFTTGFLERGKVPLAFPDAETALEAARLHVARLGGKGPLRALRIRNTLELETLWASESVLDEVRASPGFLSAGPLHPLEFRRGRLLGI